MQVLFKLERSLRLNMMVLFAAGMLFWVSLSAMLPTLPAYVEDLGGSSQDIGLVMASFAVGLLVSRSWLSWVADRYGRKPVMLIGMAALIIAPLGYMVATTLPGLILFRGIHGISIAAFATGYVTLVTDLAPPDHRGEVIGYMSLVNPLGLSVGPAIGEFLRTSRGYGALFAMAAGLGALGLICSFWIREPIQPLSRAGSQPDMARFWSLLLERRLRIPATVMLLAGLAFGTLGTFAPLFMQSTLVGFNAGWFYSIAALSSFSIRLVAGRSSDTLGRGVWISLCLILYTLSLITLWQAHHGWTFLLAGVMEGAGFGILIPMFAALMADRSLAEERARMFSLCTAGFDLGIALSGPIAGMVADTIGYRDTFGWAGLIAFAAWVVFVTQVGRNVPDSLRFSLGLNKDSFALNDEFPVTAFARGSLKT